MAASPDPLDFLELDHLLSDEERAVRDTVRGWVGDRVLPGIEGWFEAGEFPTEVAKELGAMGLLGMHLTGYECAGANAVSYGLACLELEAGDSGLPLVRERPGVALHVPDLAVRVRGAEAALAPADGPRRGDRVLRADRARRRAPTPPGCGRSAKRDGDGWVLSGTKMWITNGSVADLAVVWAKTDEGVRGFLVPTDLPGFSAKDVHRKLSLRASVTSELVFDEVRLPADAVLPDVTGMKGPLSCLTEARFGIVWGAMGAARTCFETALEYATTRVQWGKPIGGFQLTQRKLADMAVELNKGTLLALHLGRMKDDDRLLPQHVSMGKLNNVREALRIARESRSVLGASGVTLEYPVIRHMNNLESVLTYEGTSEIHTLIVGEALTGLRAFE